LKPQRLPHLLDKVESDYFRSQIETGNNTKAKNALQGLCKAYRLGLSVRPDLRTGVIYSVVGVAFNSNVDEKVRRWALNAIARVGSEGDCLPAVRHLLSNFGHEAETIASGIAALYKLCQRTVPEDVLRGMGFDPLMVTLAALQHVPPRDLNLKELPLNVDKAIPGLLKLALVVVGLGRSPENLLNPRHTDAEMVKVLGGHDDSVVSQYSVWAITENKRLGVADLGIPIADIDDYPPNVRAWVLQLLAMEANKKNSYWEIIAHGMTDPSPEVRRGLALGFKETFIDVFEPLILEWIVNEPDLEARQHLTDHVVRQAPKSRNYGELAIELYEVADPISRQTMEVSAIRTPLFTKFKAIASSHGPDLFERVTYVADQHINISNINAGVVAVGSGSASNEGTVNVQAWTQQKIEAIRGELAKLEAALHASELVPEEKERALAHVREAKIDPSPGKVEKVISLIAHLGTLAEAGQKLAPYATSLLTALGLS
jgi:hypothetical protein